MRKAFFAALVLSGCGTSTTTSSDGGTGTDYAPPYVGAWTASVTITVNGSSTMGTDDLPIQESSTNVIAFQGVCSTSTYGGQAVTADTTASGFTVVATSCSYSDPSDCASGDIDLSVSSGSGTLSNGTLSGSISGTISCGLESASYTLSFTSSTKGAYGTERALPPPAAALATAFRRPE
jgi:hypothetical protein